MSITKKGYYPEYFILDFKLKFINIVKKFRYRRIIAKGDSDVDGIENVCDSNPCYLMSVSVLLQKNQQTLIVMVWLITMNPPQL